MNTQLKNQRAQAESFDDNLTDAERLRVIEKFVERVNARAEREMLQTGNISGAHHRAIEAELSLLLNR
jgi:hypothetical protein